MADNKRKRSDGDDEDIEFRKVKRPRVVQFQDPPNHRENPRKIKRELTPARRVKHYDENVDTCVLHSIARDSEDGHT